MTAPAPVLGFGDDCSWRETRSGRIFSFAAPAASSILVTDVAHALALVNRFGGHSPWPYSVAQHSVLVSRRAEQLAVLSHADSSYCRSVARWGLFHDASEAYLGDLVRPIKYRPELAPYRELEERVMGAICVRFKLPLFRAELAKAAGAPPEVHLADGDALATEAALFFPAARRPRPWNLEGRVLHEPLPQLMWQEARHLFLERFHELYD
jgi:uncharacterized protein